MARTQSPATIDSEATAFYAYLKARVGDAPHLSVREASRLYREYLTDREEGSGAVAEGGFISTTEAAKIAGVSTQSIRNWIREGIVTNVRVTKRKGDFRIPADFMENLNLGFKGNPEVADSSAYVRRLREQQEQMTEAEYFAWLDAEEPAANERLMNLALFDPTAEFG